MEIRRGSRPSRTQASASLGEDVDVLQHLRRKRPGGRGVENRAQTLLASEANGLGHCFERRFDLKQCDAGAAISATPVRPRLASRQ